MSDSQRNEEELRLHFTEEKAPVPWKELERFFAQGLVIEIDAALDLVEVAVHVALDRAEKVKEWMESGLVRRMNDELAIRLSEANLSVTGVVSRPWIFVQLND